MFDITDLILSSVDGEVVLRAWRQPVAACAAPIAPPIDRRRLIDPPSVTIASSSSPASGIMSAHASGDLLLTNTSSGGAFSYIIIADLERAAHTAAWIPPTVRLRRQQ